jgi:hypothetical protein
LVGERKNRSWIWFGDFAGGVLFAEYENNEGEQNGRKGQEQIKEIEQKERKKERRRQKGRESYDRSVKDVSIKLPKLSIPNLGRYLTSMIA